MEVSVENTEGLGRRLKIAVPEDHIEGQVKDRVERMAQTVNMPGFRPGKVPARVVRQRYGRQIRDEVVGEVIRTSLQDAIVQEKLRPASSPTIDELNADPGAGVAFQAVFEVYPEVSVPEMAGIQVAKPVAEVVDADVERMIQTLREQRKVWNDVEREARDADRVVVDFAGSCEGEPIEGGKAEEMPIDIGAGRMMPGFEEALVGATAGDDLTVEVTFPETAPDEKVAGKPASFEVHVRSVQASELPVIDEDFMKGFGVEDGDEQKFRDEVRNNLTRELTDAVRTTTRQRVMDALLDQGTLELPQALVDGELERLHNQRRMELSYQGLDPEQIPFDAAVAEPEARRRVALGLLLAEIVKSNDMKADPETVRDRIETIASTYDESDKVINWYYSNQERLQEIESAVLEDQLVEWILERAEVSETPTTFDELLNPGQTTLEDGED